MLSIEGASNMKGSDTYILLEVPNNILTKHLLKFEFKASNVKVEYEAPIIGMVLALEVDTSTLKAKCDPPIDGKTCFRGISHE